MWRDRCVECSVVRVLRVARQVCCVWRGRCSECRGAGVLSVAGGVLSVALAELSVQRRPLLLLVGQKTSWLVLGQGKALS